MRRSGENRWHGSDWGIKPLIVISNENLSPGSIRGKKQLYEGLLHWSGSTSTKENIHASAYLNDEGLVLEARSQAKHAHVRRLVNEVFNPVENSTTGGWDTTVDSSLADGLSCHTCVCVDVLQGEGTTAWNTTMHTAKSLKAPLNSVEGETSTDEGNNLMNLKDSFNEESIYDANEEPEINVWVY